MRHHHSVALSVKYNLKLNMKNQKKNLNWDPLYKITSLNSLKISRLGFPGGAVVESLPANAGDTGSSPGLGRSHVPQSS